MMSRQLHTAKKARELRRERIREQTVRQLFALIRVVDFKETNAI